MQLFYDPSISVNSPGFSFDKEESRHIVKVLRKTEGDILHVTNGLGWLFEVQITLATERKCAVEITRSSQEAARPYRLHLAVAPTKMNERFEWFLEKATEIGVTEITPLICDRSERKTVKTDRFEKIIVSAMKQSGQLHLPTLRQPVSFREFVSSANSEIKAIAHCMEDQKENLKSLLKPASDLTLLIGPEGDFSPKEVALALSKAFIPVSLGHTRLRTETAAVVAAHSVAFVNG